MIKELRATLMKSQHLRTASGGGSANSQAMRARLQSANNTSGRIKSFQKGLIQQPQGAHSQTLRTRKMESRKLNRVSVPDEQQLFSYTDGPKYGNRAQNDLSSPLVRKPQTAASRARHRRDNSEINLKQNIEYYDRLGDYNDIASRPTGPTLHESTGDLEREVSKPIFKRVKSANATAHSQTQKNLKSMLRTGNNQNSQGLENSMVFDKVGDGHKAMNAWTSQAAVNFSQTQNLKTEADLSPMISQPQRIFAQGTQQRQAKSTTRNQVSKDRYGFSGKSRYGREQSAIPSMMDITKTSTQPSSNDVKHKLYMRIIVRMTEVFGGDSRSIKVIKEIIDKKLDGATQINSKFIDEIQKEIHSKLGGQSFGNMKTSRNVMDQNLGHGFQSKRKSQDFSSSVDYKSNGGLRAMRQSERGNLYTNPMPSVMVYSRENKAINQEYTPSKVWSPRISTANTGMRFQRNETSPDEKSPRKSERKVNRPRKSLPVDVSALFKNKPEKTVQEKIQEIEDQKQHLKDQVHKNSVDVNIYGLKTNVDMGPIFKTSWNNINQDGSQDIEVLDVSAQQGTKNQLQNQMRKIAIRNGQREKRFDEMSPSERNLQRNELLQKFKSNVMSMTGLDIQKDSSGLNKTTHGTFFKNQDSQLSDLLVNALNSSDTFSQRLNQTSNSGYIKSQSLQKFQRKSTYSKKNEKLWSLLDKYKSHFEEQKAEQEQHLNQKKTKKFIDGIKSQMRASEKQKHDHKMEVQKDMQEVLKQKKQFEQDRQKKQQEDEEKRIKIFEMMQQNIQNHKKNQQQRISNEKATEHLVNPVEFQLMDQHEKMRVLASKEKKLTDDVVNRKTFYTQKISHKQTRDEEKDHGSKNVESFFERLRREDHARELENKKSEMKKREALAHSAAYVDGECLLNTQVIEDLALLDERKADKLMQENNKKEDQEKMQKYKLRQNQLMQTSFANLNKIKQKEQSLFSIQNEKLLEHPEQDGNNIYATIRVQEIVDGFTEQDFRARDKQKAKNFKQQLDDYVQHEDNIKGDNMFFGMTDAEILVNKKEWTALGLM